jgi:hypothetical protein
VTYFCNVKTTYLLDGRHNGRFVFGEDAGCSATDAVHFNQINIIKTRGTRKECRSLLNHPPALSLHFGSGGCRAILPPGVALSLNYVGDLACDFTHKFTYTFMQSLHDIDECFAIKEYLSTNYRTEVIYG